MKIYQIQFKQQLPITVDEAWDFFSNPTNLPGLSPPWMQFNEISVSDRNIYEGMISIYSLKPLLGIKLNWVTEITQIEDKSYFIDEQRFGPYRFWHHEHRIIKMDEGIELVDTVHYALPFGWLGRIAHTLQVKQKIQDVFTFRYHTLNKLFGSIVE